MKRAIVCCLVCFAVGCGAAEGGRPAVAPGVAPTMPTEKAPRTVEEALQRIDRARSEIDSRRNVPSPPPTAPEGTDAPSATPSHDVVPCSSPCRALGSMRRAVEGLCELTGANDDRCTNAKKTLEESRTKVGPCTCE